MELALSKYEIISEHEFFKDLSPQFIELIVDSAYMIHIDKHQNLFSQGEIARNFYLVLDGMVIIQMYAGELGFVTLKEITPNNIIGWSWLLSPDDWIFSAEATINTTLLSFDGERLRDICESNSEFGYQMAYRFSLLVAQRLKEVRSRLANALY